MLLIQIILPVTRIEESTKNGSSGRLLSGNAGKSNTFFSDLCGDQFKTTYWCISGVDGFFLFTANRIQGLPNHTNVTGSIDIKKASNMPQVKNSPNSVKVEGLISDTFLFLDST